MPDSVLRSDATLGEWLTARAHAASERRLLLDVAAGGLVVPAVAFWRPAVWPALLGVGLCFVAFGGWALADRRLAPPDAWPPGAPLPTGGVPAPGGVGRWRAVRALAGVVGVLAAALALFGLLFGVLGTWIS